MHNGQFTLQDTVQVTIQVTVIFQFKKGFSAFVAQVTTGYRYFLKKYMIYIYIYIHIHIY